MSQRVEITGVAKGGDGVCRIDGQVCFVPYALPGEKIEVEFAPAAKGVLRGKVVKVLEPSPDRVEAPCSIFGECGACTWLHYQYPAQAESKQAIVRDAFQRIAKLDPALEWADNPDLRTGYRTRASFHGDGSAWGFHEAKTRRVVPVESCPLCHDRLNEALAALREMNLEKPVELVVNPEGDDVLVWTKQEAPKLRKRFAAYNSRNDGHARHSFTFDGVPIVNGTFSQSSLLLNRLLVRIVREAVGSPSTLLDLYCGNGNLSLGHGEDVQITGVDHNPHSINAANARERGNYVVGGEADCIEAIKAGGWDVVLLDPPRAGAKAIVDTLAGCAAKKLVYVSCDPATLARDAAVLVKAGWAVSRCTVIDMFPNTSHIETVCEFSRG